MKIQRVLAIILVAGMPGLLAMAQQTEYDPLKDTLCHIINTPAPEQWESGFMWYPGQLSAHLQKKLKKISETRCVNVGYPGKFTEPQYQTFFRNTIRISSPVEIRWRAPGTTELTVNGRQVNTTNKRYTLQPGKTVLEYKITTNDRLPCLLVDDEGLIKSKDWQVSLDGENWNIPETDNRYNKPDIFPDDNQEVTVRIPVYRYIPVRNSTFENNRLVIRPNGYALIDFRHLEVGTAGMDITGNGKVIFRVGETPEEALNPDENLFEQYPLQVYELDGNTQHIQLPERALRYLYIECRGDCEIDSIVFDAAVWPVDYKMTFESSDPQLNALWKAGAATLHASMHGFYLDGIKRDYLPWAMDAIVSSLAGDYLFGDRQVTRNGLSLSLMPPDPDKSDFGIIDYPLHALIGFKHEYLRYGDLHTSFMYKDRIVAMLKLYVSLQDVNGFISSEHSTTGFIPGWATKNGPSGQGIATYAQIMLYHNYCIAAWFARLWKDKPLSEKYDTLAKTLRTNILQHFWDDTRKAFINGYTPDGEKDIRISHHAQYWAILAGIFPEEHYINLFDVVLPAIPYYYKDISYEKGYEFMAYVKAGRLKDVFSILDNVWGGWLKQGHTRFPENFSPQVSRSDQLMFYSRPYGLSLCHGGNGVPPVLAILRGILGFEQSDKSPNEYSLNPELLHLEWIKGEIPVKEGIIRYHIRKTGENEIQVPDGCILRVNK